MSRFRRRLLLSGLAGLVANGILAAVVAWLVASGAIKAPLPYPLVTLLATLILAGFSLAEIPIMIVAMRHLDQALALGLNAVFVFFAAVYGAPVLLLTGSLGWGLALCALGVVRLAASLLFVNDTVAP
jgi:hypothetical protein